MSELRWILLAIGAVVIGGIYVLWGRDFKFGLGRGQAGADLEQRREPSLSGDGSVESFSRLISSDQPDLPATDQNAAGGPSSAEPGRPDKQDDQKPQKIVVLHVAARGSQRFGGEEIFAALQAEQLQLGKFNIFHRLVGESSESLFSVANMVEPGSFDPKRLDEISTPGVSLFLVLPGISDGAEAFSDMLITARDLAQRLGADVLDEHGSSLSNQTAGHIREEILAFQLRLRALDDVQA